MMIHACDYICRTDGKNGTPAIAAAVEALHDGDTLCLDGGRYDLYPEGALIRSYYISNNDSGKKPIAFPLIGKRNVTVDGGGAELMFHGDILPFAVDGSEGVTLENFSVDYPCPVYAQAEIIEADSEKTVLRFDGEQFFCRVERGRFCFYHEEDGWEDIVERALTLEFDRDTRAPSAFKPAYFPYCGEPCDHGFLGGMFRDVTLEELEPNVIAMHGNIGFVHTVGNYVVMTHSTREYPGIFVTGSKNVTIESVTLYHTTAMGVIAQLSGNITLDGVRAEVREGSGRLLSVNADATHFVNCRGFIHMKNCKFVRMMDDACNIHGIYSLVKELRSDGTLLLGFGHHQQKGIQLYRPGDLVSVIDSETMEEKVRANVLRAVLTSPDCIELTLDRPVGEPGAHWVAENLSTAPDVVISDCESGFNRPRGFLISSAGKVLVERCKFYNMNCGIQLGGEMKDWYESGAVTDVTVRDCDFANSAYAGGNAVSISPKLRCEAPRDFFHGRIAIENNTFTQSAKRIMNATLTRELTFRGNRFHADETLPKRPANGESGVRITNCGKIDYEDVLDV